VIVAIFNSDQQRAETLAGRLSRYPELEEKVKELLDVVDNVSGDANKADDAEDLICEQLREIGQRALQDWAERKHLRMVRESDARQELTRREKRGSIGSRRSDESG
jgi:hypothetical protein